MFLLPPAAFYEAGAALPSQPEGVPYRPTYTNPSFKGSKGKGKGKALGLRKKSTQADFEDDLQFILDHNRIRAVRIAFKAIAGDEEQGRTDGIELDPGRPGTAPTVLLESTYELKVFSTHLAPRSRT